MNCCKYDIYFLQGSVEPGKLQTSKLAFCIREISTKYNKKEAETWINTIKNQILYNKKQSRWGLQRELFPQKNFLNFFKGRNDVVNKNDPFVVEPYVSAQFKVRRKTFKTVRFALH